MASEAESSTTGCMIRGYHIYNDVWSSYIREVLYCHHDEISEEGPFVSGIAAN